MFWWCGFKVAHDAMAREREEGKCDEKCVHLQSYMVYASRSYITKLGVRMPNSSTPAVWEKITPSRGTHASTRKKALFSISVDVGGSVAFTTLSYWKCIHPWKKNRWSVVRPVCAWIYMHFALQYSKYILFVCTTETGSPIYFLWGMSWRFEVYIISIAHANKALSFKIRNLSEDLSLNLFRLK